MNEIVEMRDPIKFSSYPKRWIKGPDSNTPTSYDVHWYWSTGSSGKPSADSKLPTPYLQLHGSEKETDIEEIKLSNYKMLANNILLTSLTVSKVL